MKLVLDASVALSWLQLPSQTHSGQALTILEGLIDKPALVPLIWKLEVAQERYASNGCGKPRQTC